MARYDGYHIIHSSNAHVASLGRGDPTAAIELNEGETAALCGMFWPGWDHGLRGLDHGLAVRIRAYLARGAFLPRTSRPTSLREHVYFGPLHDLHEREILGDGYAVVDQIVFGNPEVLHGRAAHVEVRTQRL